MKKVYFLFFIFIFEILSLVFNFRLFAQENVNVSLTVNPRASDFQFAYTSTDGLVNVTENIPFSYQILYGANASAQFSTNTELEADFSDDLAPGGSHVLDYVPGSASNGYGGAVPIVDLINRKITWSIAGLPAGTTNQTVAFQLKTNSNYTGGSIVSFTTRAKMSNQYVTMPGQAITQYYQYSLSITPTPTPTSASTPVAVTNPTSAPAVSTTTPNPTVVPGAITQSVKPRIVNIDFTNITASTATISVQTTVPAISIVSYGIAPNSLLQKVQGGNYALLSRISLENLKSNTVYYFRVESIDENGNKISSEIYKFKTAEENSVPFVLEEGAIAIESLGIRIFSKIIDRNSAPGFVILTDNTDFTLSYTPKNPIEYKSFDVIIKSKNVPDKKVNLLQKDSHFYISNLKTGNPGQYEIFLKVLDAKGNLAEQKIADLKVTQKLSVRERGSSKPLGDARIFLYYFNSRTGKYEPLSKEIFGNIKNPLFTDLDGKVNLILPTGRYRVEASAFLHDKTSQDFTLGPGEGEEFPQLQLNKNPFNILNIFQFIKDWLNDLLLQMSGFLYSSIGNIRIFNTVAVIVTGALTLISMPFFLFRTHINPKHLPLFFMFGLHMALNKHVGKYIFGVIKDKNDLPVTRAIIQLIDKKTGEILAHTTSNKKGHFHLQNIKSKQDLKLVIDKDGFIETERVLGAEDIPPQGLEIKLDTGSRGSGSVGIGGLRLIEHIGGSLFETTLILSIILEIFFLSNFGFVRTLPFFVLSIFNILLWIFFLKESNR